MTVFNVLSFEDKKILLLWCKEMHLYYPHTNAVIFMSKENVLYSKTSLTFYVGFEVFTAMVLESIATCLLAGLLNYSSTLKMEAIRSSETSGTTLRTTRRHSQKMILFSHFMFSLLEIFIVYGRHCPRPLHSIA
jgi:hypothetical protein